MKEHFYQKIFSNLELTFHWGFQSISQYLAISNIQSTETVDCLKTLNHVISCSCNYKHHFLEVNHRITTPRRITSWRSVQTDLSYWDVRNFPVIMLHSTFLVSGNVKFCEHFNFDVTQNRETTSSWEDYRKLTRWNCKLRRGVFGGFYQV